jgi:hypothetical protein
MDAHPHSTRIFEPAESPSGQINRDALVVDAGPPSEIPARSGLAVPDDGRFAELRNSFFLEFEPRGPAEVFLALELVRRAHNLERWTSISASVQTGLADQLQSLVGSTSGLPPGAKTLIASAATLAPCLRAELLSCSQNRAFLKTLNALQKLQTKRRGVRANSLADVPLCRFTTEKECEAYLVAWQSAQFCCSGCGTRTNYYLQSRQSLECAACHRQAGIRAGTVMAASPLQFMKWFAAIHTILAVPTVSTSELAERLAMNRLATARDIAHRIRGAVDSADQDQLMAGLQRFLFLPGLSVGDFLKSDVSLPPIAGNAKTLT